MKYATVSDVDHPFAIPIDSLTDMQPAGSFSAQYILNQFSSDNTMKGREVMRSGGVV